MTREETEKAIAVMQAWVDGKEIQFLNADTLYQWTNKGGCPPRWNWDNTKYRTKPEPREWWLDQSNARVYAISQELPNRPMVRVREVTE